MEAYVCKINEILKKYLGENQIKFEMEIRRND